ncbi:MAG: TonB-dependent receptor [Flavobacteriaceae bacterium]|nr:TonB-dependent receptor [Bacteroidia bacterium]MBT8287103.1 TonB-dependent receptor [Bacteroidia bacterium]NNF74290.1 TonB-dependent receptor [Flavobacteriaceae bacterium]NNK73558.1 TonB-dependent receptor [Flavobacteriaceae bacterium]
MKIHSWICLFGLLLVFPAFSQQTIITGSVIETATGEPITEATITIEETQQSTMTDELGVFRFDADVPLGEQVLVVSKAGYVSKRYPIVVNEGQTVNITDMTLEIDLTANNDFIISLSDDELNADEGFTDNISGLLQSSRDVFLNAAAYDFSSTFFRPRGLDNANGKVLINGVEMNKQFNGRPQWANWGGLNDVQRNQVFSRGIAANEYNFGDLAGTTNIIMRASKYRKGGRVSVASANRSYQGRLMGSYSSGLLEGGWSYSVLASRRFGDEGYIDGTLYDSNSFFAAVEKQLGDNHSLNFTGIYAQNRRGRSTAVTDEVNRLKGREYNPFWGRQEGDLRNSRVRDVIEPILMLNHFWQLSEKTSLNTNMAYQFGKIGNTRIDNGGTQLEIGPNGETFYSGGARNPDPAYYQNLPSYHLRFDNPTPLDFQNAFVHQQEFVTNGQLDWADLYEANALPGNTATYAIQEDRNDDTQFTANTILNTEISDKVTLNASLSYRKLNSENFANLKDLLGATAYLDVDSFAEEDPQSSFVLTDIAQSDTNNPNRVVVEGDRYKYNFEIDANVINGFAQAQFKYSKIDFYVGANIGKTTYQRNGLFENGYFIGNSFGKSEKLDFSTYGIKGGLVYKFTGRHLLDVNAAYFTKAPSIRNSFSNSRQNNNVVTGLTEETINSIDASYIYRSPLVKARLTGFYTNFSDGSDIAFYFTENLAGLGIEEDAFVQEVMTNIERRHIGAELGIEAQITPTIKLKAAASVGQYTYANNPDLYLTSDDFPGELRFGDGKTFLKDYHVAGGPERAYQLGFEYRDPDFWWVGATTNYFSNAYVDVSALARSENFGLDYDGLPINGYDDNVARDLLKQEEFNDYFLVNIIGGKSWKINDYFVGFFATINNVLDQEYKTGGFEQSRLANYNDVLEDKSRDYGPVFGSRYFFGNGTTYYLNLYFRF